MYSLSFVNELFSEEACFAAQAGLQLLSSGNALLLAWLSMSCITQRYNFWSRGEAVDNLVKRFYILEKDYMTLGLIPNTTPHHH